METSEALRIAGGKNLDLIEIAPTATPPVCKITDFGKFKYEREKGEREHGKKQRTVEIKGVRIGFTTGKHDLELRAKQVEKFLNGGNKVRIDMRLSGREKAHRDLALEKFNQFLEIIPAEFTLEAPPRRLPNGFIAVITKK
jgi:translation initiation factor IF-3